MDEEIKVNHGKKSKKIMLLAAVLIVTAVLIIAAAYASYSKSKRYSAALILFDEGEYISAYEKLSTIGLKYENVAVLLPIYEAYFLYESNDYQKAISAFNALNSNGKYNKIIWECSYKDAVNLLEQKRFDEAKKAFQAINTDGKCDDMILECSYGEAVRLLEDCYFDEAVSAFKKINANGRYNDMIWECYYAKAKNLLEDKSFDNAIDVFESVIDYKDSVQMILECHYQKALLITDNESALRAFKELIDSGYKNDDVDLKIYEIAKKMFDAEQYSSLIYTLSFPERYEPTEKLLIEAYMEQCSQLTKDGKNLQALNLYVSLFTSTENKELSNTTAELIYEGAQKLFNSKEYYDASKYFFNISDYKDSYEMYQESLYLHAFKTLDNGNLEAAYNLFTKVQSYKDSQNKATEAYYAWASLRFEKKQYEDAAKMFEKLGNYKDSPEMKKESQYQRALYLIGLNETAKIQSAIELLNSVGLYKDSLQQIYDAKAAIDLLHKKRFINTSWYWKGNNSAVTYLSLRTDGSAIFSFVLDGTTYLEGSGNYAVYDDRIVLEAVGVFHLGNNWRYPGGSNEIFSFSIKNSTGAANPSAKDVKLVLQGSITLNNKTYSPIEMTYSGKA